MIYGMTRNEYFDTDCSGCAANGRASGVYNLKGKGGVTRAFHSLRGGKKAAARRIHKRRARAEGRAACNAD